LALLNYFTTKELILLRKFTPLEVTKQEKTQGKQASNGV